MSVRGKVWTGINTFHTSVGCAERNQKSGASKLVPVEEAIDRELIPCGVCMSETKEAMRKVSVYQSVKWEEALKRLEWSE